MRHRAPHDTHRGAHAATRLSRRRIRLCAGTAAGLVVRGMLQTGVARVVSASFAVVAATGAAAGILTAVCAHHAIARSILPTGGFLLVVAALAAIVFWAHSDRGVETARA